MRDILRTALVCSIAGAGLSGCVESLPAMQVGSGEIRAALPGAGHGSARAATVALASLDGAPDSIDSRFVSLFDKEAGSREITVVDPSVARYLVRGYLSALHRDAGGTDLTYVYDIFDANAQTRVDRVADTLTLSTAGDEPWAGIDQSALTSLAANSADRLAAALAATPVAQAAASSALVNAQQVASSDTD